MCLSRGTLRKILNFCLGEEPPAFKIQLLCVSNTLIAERCEKSDSIILHGSQNTGYGHSFEQAFTRPQPGCENSTGHHRVLLYNISGVKCSVCSEVDASYTEPRANAPFDNPPRPAEEHQNSPNADNPPTGLDSREEPDRGKVRVIRRGNGTPQSHVAEIKISRRRLETAIPQMWFGRNKYFIRGIRDRSSGCVTQVTVTNLPEEFARWEQKRDMQLALRKMETLLLGLRDVVKGAKEKSCVAVYDGNDHSSLMLFACTWGRVALPADVVEKFWDAELD